MAPARPLSSRNSNAPLASVTPVPVRPFSGMKWMTLSGAAVLETFGLDLAPEARLYMYFPIGLTVFGIFGSFTYYLPELFPTRLRATGAGFCYNIGRVVAAIGPFVVGAIASRGVNGLNSAVGVLFWVGFVPIVGLAFLPWVVETKGRALQAV